MRRFVALLCLSACIGIFLLGCATITKGTSQQIAITSNVDGATLYLDGEEFGKTPFNGIVKKNKKEVKVSKDGYRTETIVLSKTMEGMFWGNIILGGTIGSITDFATGGAYAYAPATYQVDLKLEDQSALEFQTEYATRKFSMVYMDEISRDLASNNNEYLATLMEIMGANHHQEETIAAIREALENSGGSQVEFGDAVVALL